MSKSKTAAKSKPAAKSVPGKDELRAQCKALGVKGYGAMNNEQMQAAIEELGRTQVKQAQILAGVMDGVAPRDTVATFESAPVVAEVVVAPVEAPAPAEKAATAKKSKPATVTTVEQNGIKRPAADSLCGRVWQALDDLRAAGADPTAKNAAAAFEGVAIAAATIRTQTQRWKTFHNVKREEKPTREPKVAAPAVVSEGDVQQQTA